SFAGSRRDKLLAHLALALAGSALLTIGTAVNSTTAVAALVTVPVTFAVFFAGVAGPNAAGGVTGALLAYVLPAASPGTIGMVPDRLVGWWLASVAGTAAVLAFSPRAPGDALRAAAARLAGALADELDAGLRGATNAERLDDLLAAKHDLMAQFSATPYRPTGLTSADEALANCVELLEWSTGLVADSVRERPDLREISDADRELLEAASAVLRDAASLFAGEDVRPDLVVLRERRARSHELADELAGDQAGFREAAQASFHAHTIASAVLAFGADASVAHGVAAPARAGRFGRGRARMASGADRATRVAAAVLRDASLRSVWFINSLRGAVALAAAVAVADLSSVQHGFWVVLGTLSVLRTNAASTGSTAIRALAGTAVGFVIGGALLVAIGSTSAALWIALPFAVLIAAYAPGTAPFAVGQAAFTVTIAVLFNLLVPVGWKVGVLRIEDVALGCGVSIAVGLLFWPRGVGSVVGDNLADAFRSGADYLHQAVEWGGGWRAAAPDAAGEAATAALRLDDALRAFIAEQGAKQIAKQELWRLVGGSMRLRLTADAVARMPPDPNAPAAAREALRRRTSTLTAWYERLAELLGRRQLHVVRGLQAPTFAPADVVHASSGWRYGVWLCEHLDHLSEHLAELVQPAEHVAEIRRRPWWR
ncbi:MAG TPA: FUSC family protein, partial [Solirubrobacteraceae bacterium]|nr:FUSC family protein [Solirubrobacteraceae bacterium]